MEKLTIVTYAFSNEPSLAYFKPLWSQRKCVLPRWPLTVDTENPPHVSTGSSTQYCVWSSVKLHRHDLFTNRPKRCPGGNLPSGHVSAQPNISISHRIRAPSTTTSRRRRRFSARALATFPTAAADRSDRWNIRFCSTLIDWLIIMKYYYH